MENWIKAMPVENLKSGSQLFVHNGKRIALFKLDDGIFAIDDECSHANASLSEGWIEEGQVECPQHGARFDIRTGKNLRFPAVTPVAAYPTKIVDGFVFVSFEN
ncbi:MAG: non-heme iron oxygenase ferredoxin subunit [Candidatus Zhuqueibacterota bacterium]